LNEGLDLVVLTIQQEKCHCQADFLLAMPEGQKRPGSFLFTCDREDN
jgi:hypothetical protein